MCLLQVSSLSFIHNGDDAATLLQCVGNPIVEGRFSVNVIFRSIFGGLHRVALFEIRDLLPSSGTIPPSNTNCRNLLSIDFRLNQIDPSTNISPPNPERGNRTKLEILFEEVFPNSIE